MRFGSDAVFAFPGRRATVLADAQHDNHVFKMPSAEQCRPSSGHATPYRSAQFLFATEPRNRPIGPEYRDGDRQTSCRMHLEPVVAAPAVLLFIEPRSFCVFTRSARPCSRANDWPQPGTGRARPDRDRRYAVLGVVDIQIGDYTILRWPQCRRNSFLTIAAVSRA
jgi:hypothetical protein